MRKVNVIKVISVLYSKFIGGIKNLSGKFFTQTKIALEGGGEKSMESGGGPTPKKQFSQEDGGKASRGGNLCSFRNSRLTRIL